MTEKEIGDILVLYSGDNKSPSKISDQNNKYVVKNNTEKRWICFLKQKSSRLNRKISSERLDK